MINNDLGIDPENIGYVNILEDIDIDSISKLSLEIRDKKLKEINDRNNERELELKLKIDERSKISIDIDNRERREIKVLDENSENILTTHEAPSYFDYMKITPKEISEIDRSTSLLSRAKVLTEDRSNPCDYITFSKTLSMIPELNSIRSRGIVAISNSDDLTSYIPMWEEMMKARIDKEISDLDFDKNDTYEKISDLLDMKKNLNFHEFCVQYGMTEDDVLSDFRNTVSGKCIANKDDSDLMEYKTSSQKINDKIIDLERQLNIAMSINTDTRLLRMKLDKLRELRDGGKLNPESNIDSILDDVKLFKNDPTNSRISFDDYMEKKLKLLMQKDRVNPILIVLSSIKGRDLIRNFKTAHPTWQLTESEILEYYIKTGEGLGL